MVRKSSRVAATVAAALLRRRLGPLLADPGRAQADLLRRLLRTAASTEWGRRHGFADLAREPDVVAAYRARVPLAGYDDVRDDVRRMMAGEPDVLWPGRIRYFGITSGTTAQGKVLPLSPERLKRNRRFTASVILSYLRETGNTAVLGGSRFGMPNPPQVDPNFPDARIGGMTAILADSAPRHLRRVLRPPVEFQGIRDRGARFDAMLDRAMDRDIRLLSVQPAYTPALLRRLIERYNRKYGTRVTTAGEIWPNLQLHAAGAVALAPYRAMIEELVGLPEFDFLEIYAATESPMAFQTDLADPAMELYLDGGTFFEFVRVEDSGSEAPRRYALHEVESGVAYTVYVTTCSGLWAYGMRDVVRFTRTRPHRLVVAGRSVEMLDGSNEALFPDQAWDALAAACQATGSRVADWHVASFPPDRDGLTFHRWFVEFATPPGDPAAFAAALDAHIRNANRSYDNARQAGAVAPPVIVAVPPGTFASLLRERSGGENLQAKLPRMSSQPGIRDRLLEIARGGAPAHGG